METILLIIILALSFFVGYKIYHKKTTFQQGGQSTTEKTATIQVPEKEGCITFNNFSINDPLKEILKNTPKWNDFSYLYIADSLIYFDKSLTKLANGIFVTLDNDNHFYNYRHIVNGIIIDSGRGKI